MKRGISVAIFCSLALAACGHNGEQKSATGAGTGAVAGAVVGGPVGAVVGAAVGGAGGAAENKVQEDNNDNKANREGKK